MWSQDFNFNHKLQEAEVGEFVTAPACCAIGDWITLQALCRRMSLKRVQRALVERVQEFANKFEKQAIERIMENKRSLNYGAWSTSPTCVRRPILPAHRKWS